MVYLQVLNSGCEPKRMLPGDAAMDLKCTEDTTVYPGRAMKVPLGVCFKIPIGEYVQITARSSVALQGIVGHVGIIDSSFNGNEVCAILMNIGDSPVFFSKGERVAQAIALEYGDFETSEDAIDSTGSKEGFGSSGRM